MDKRLFAIAVSLLLLGVVIGSASAQDLFPEVTLSFDSLTSTYTYHVLVPQNNTYPFGQLLIFAHASSWNGYEETWTIEGPIVGGQNMDWLAGFSEGDYGDTCEWRAMTGQEVTFGPWEGDFIIVAPDTIPVAGQGMTKDGVVDSTHYFNIDVPGNLIPEPSSLMALGSIIALAGGLAIRRRR